MNDTQFQYDELVQIGVDYQDFKEVARYDARMHALRNIAAEVDELIVATRPDPAASVLEIGTGTGEFAIALSERVKEVLAVDVSSVMLDYARKKAELRERHNINFLHAGFLTFTAEPERFDIIFSQLALHHLPDFWKYVALAKIANSLKKGGRFYLKDVVYPSGIADYTAYFHRVIEGFEHSAGSQFTKEIITHIRQEYSTLDWVMEGMLKKAGLALQNATVANGFITTYLCLK